MEAPPPREAEVAWRAGDVPVSTRHGEAYYGDAEALAEKRHVFIAGNDLPARFRTAIAGAGRPGPGFAIAELGFGTGLNALAAAAEWRAAGGPGSLRYTAFEQYPLPAGAMARALRPWPELAPLAEPLAAAWGRGERRFVFAGTGPGRGAVEIDVIEGDARETLPLWHESVDAWFLDGFSPARNPELWEPGLMALTFARARLSGTLATYSAASGVRAALEAAGWRVSRLPGFGRKRHMTVARKEDQGPTGSGLFADVGSPEFEVTR